MWNDLSQAIAARLSVDPDLASYDVFVDAPPNNANTPFILITVVNERENYKYGDSQVVQTNFDITIVTPVDSATSWSDHQDAQTAVRNSIRRHQFTLTNWYVSLINFVQANRQGITKDVLQTVIEFETVAEQKAS